MLGYAARASGRRAVAIDALRTFLKLEKNTKNPQYRDANQTLIRLEAGGM